MDDKRPAIFLDRDGTLIEEVNFLSRVEDLRVFPYTLNALTAFSDAGYLLLVVTNQSGIGRGLYTIDDMTSIHDAMQVRLGGLIDDFYFCPHLPDEGCRCRKPSTGMIDIACEKFGIDLERSWVIGDKALDVGLGKQANTSTVLVATGYGASIRTSLEESPTHFARDLDEAARLILGR
jgi:D-glycero-D-manno-heptose 1,7-bisphosphate phosphatase